MCRIRSTQNKVSSLLLSSMKLRCLQVPRRGMDTSSGRVGDGDASIVG